MTRDEAIINLKLSQNRIGGIKKEEWVALQMAIEALTYQNPSKPNNTCDVDRISRANAILWVKTECNPYGKPTL